MSAIITSPEYKFEIEKLKKDVHVQRMAQEISTGHTISEFVHSDGTPKWGFMEKTNNEYTKRSGKPPQMFGSVARAMLELLKGKV